MRMFYPAAAGVLLATIACSPPAPRATAEAFMDAHYLAIDLREARLLTAALARNKVDREIELTQGTAIDEQTEKPRINYRLERAEHGPDASLYAYELTIRAPGLKPYTKRVVLTLRRSGASWKVTNFDES